MRKNSIFNVEESRGGCCFDGKRSIAKMISGAHLSSFEDEKCKGREGGMGGRGVAMVERTPSPSRSSNFAVKRGARKTKTRKAQREDSRNALFQGGAAPCANTARQMDCSGRCVPPPHRVPSRDKSNHCSRVQYCTAFSGRVHRGMAARPSTDESSEHQCNHVSSPRFFARLSPLAISFPFLRPLSSSHHCRRIVFLAR